MSETLFRPYNSSSAWGQLYHQQKNLGSGMPVTARGPSLCQEGFSHLESTLERQGSRIRVRAWPRPGVIWKWADNFATFASLAIMAPLRLAWCVVWHKRHHHISAERCAWFSPSGRGVGNAIRFLSFLHQASCFRASQGVSSRAMVRLPVHGLRGRKTSCAAYRDMGGYVLH
jgi:hypothetical protein